MFVVFYYLKFIINLYIAPIEALNSPPLGTSLLKKKKPLSRILIYLEYLMKLELKKLSNVNS